MGSRVIAQDLYSLILMRDADGVVHSVFDNAINIVTDDDIIITILNDTKDISPMSMVLDHRTFSGLFTKVGEEVHIRGYKIMIGDDIRIDAADFSRWTPHRAALYKPLDKKQVSENIDLLYGYVVKYGKHEGIGPVICFIGEADEYSYDESLQKSQVQENNDDVLKSNHYVSFILERLKKFVSDFELLEVDEIQESFSKIIGFGPGLTPSTDDFLCGFIISIDFLLNYHSIDTVLFDEIKTAILQKIKGKTTRISEEMLKHCFSSNVSRNHNDMLLTMLYETGLDLENLISLVISYGDTSGTDFLAGVYTAFSVFDEEKIRRKVDVHQI